MLILLLLMLPACGKSEGLLVLTNIEYQRGFEISEDAWRPVGEDARIDPERNLPVWFRVHPPVLPVPDPAVRASWGLFFDMARVGAHDIKPEGDPLIVPVDEPGAPVMFRSSGLATVWVPRFVAGSQRALWADAIRAETPGAVVGGAVLVVGALLLGAGLRRGGSRAYRGLGLFFAALGIISLINLRHWIMLVPLSPALKIVLHHVATILYPIGFADFVLGTFGDGRFKIIRRGLWVYGAFVVVVLVLHLGHILDFRVSRDGVGIFIIIFCVQGMVRAAARARAGDSSGKAFLVGIGLLLAFGLYDIAISIGGVQALPFGILSFAVSMVVVLERQFVRARDELQVSAVHLQDKVDTLEVRNREVQSLNQELRHQIAERSRQMVQSLRTGDGLVAESRSLQPGDLVGERYRVVRALGQGGMGSVFEVLRITDERKFALKMMSGAVSSRAAARFAREAEIAARVSDDNLVPVVDVGGVQTGELFLVMELVEGRSLEEARDRWGDVPWALDVLCQVARGLAALHAAGVVHRDLKPANVLLSRGPDGREIARIADFGISHLDTDPIEPGAQPGGLALQPAGAAADEGLDSAGVANAQTLVASSAGSASGTLAVVDSAVRPSSLGPSLSGAAQQLTATGVVMGTPAYMAPEGATGARAARPASDMFAFGLIAYELVSGRSPFDLPPARLALVGGSLPPIPPLPASLPPAVVGLVTSCLLMNPEARPTPGDAINALQAATSAQRTPASAEVAF
jgi:serine/threonine protein kinase